MRSMTNTRWLTTRATLCLWSILAANGVQAQSATPHPPGAVLPEKSPMLVTDEVLPYRQFDKIEITGSSIVRKEQTQALPVLTLNRQDLQRSQIPSLLGLLQRQPSLFNGSGLSELGLASGGYAAAALHGLPNGTLVLLNGKRLAPHGLQSLTSRERGSTDLSLLPLSAVDRIEILSDGASTLYGTDAIAGVINVITRSDIRGFEASADLTHPHGGAAQERSASLRWGTGDLARQGYSLRLMAEAQANLPLRGSDRAATREGLRTFRAASQDYRIVGPLVIGFTGVAQLYDLSASKFFSTLYDPQRQTCNGPHVPYAAPLTGGCRLVPYDLYDVYPEEQHLRLLATAERALSNGDVAYVELLHSQSQATAGVNDWKSVSGRLENRPGALGYDLALAGGLNAASTVHFWRPDLPALRNHFERDQSRMAVGLKGQWQHWDYHASAYLSQSGATQTQEDVSYQSLATLGIKPSNQQRGEMGYIANPGVLSVLDTSNPLTAQLLGLREWLSVERGRTRTGAVELRTSGAIGEIDGRNILLGMGTERRFEEVQYEKQVAGKQPDFRGSRHNLAAYVELQIPLRKDLEVIASGRTDRYSDVGNTRHAKLAARWAPTARWSLRGSLGSGFRAPSVGQTTRLDNDFYFSSVNSILCTEALQRAALEVSRQTNRNVVCRDSDWLDLYTNGNPDLKPEQSRQATLGMAFVPHRNLTFAADFWRVRITDTLQFESIDALMANPAQQPQAFTYTPTPDFNPQTQNLSYRLAASLRMRNLGQSLREGVDLEARWRQPTAWGQLTLHGQATVMLTSRDQKSAQAEATSDLGTYSAITGTVTPRLRALFGAGLARDQLMLLVSLQHRSGYTDMPVRATNISTQVTQTVTNHRVASFSTVDIAGNWQLNRKIQLRMALRNAFNREPPLSFYSVSPLAWGVNPIENDLFGRTLQFGLNARF